MWHFYVITIPLSLELTKYLAQAALLEHVKCKKVEIPGPAPTVVELEQTLYTVSVF